MKKIHGFILVLAAVAAFATGLYMSQSTPQVSELTQLYKQPRELKPFELIDENGQLFDLNDLKGKWSLLFLGYLSCPDICPTTMMKLSQLLPDLKAQQNNAQVLFLSVDPKRDKPDNIKQYTSYFDDEIIGLRAEHKALYPLVRNLGLMYSIPPNDVTEGYYVDHSGSVVLINPQGQITAMFKPKINVAEIPAIDADTLLKDFTIITSN